AILNSNPLLSTLGGTAAAGNSFRVRNLLNFFSGSLSSVRHEYFLTDSKKLDAFSDYRNSSLITTKIVANEWDVFFKDDYKIRKNLTLNLGVRYEYYAVPYV